jgi:hypothetical protein
MYYNNRFKLGDVVRIHNTNYKHYGVVGKVYQIAYVITDSKSSIEPEYIHYMIENEYNIYTGIPETDISFVEAPKPEWTPAKQNNCVLRKIKAIDYKNTNYITEFIDGNESLNKHYNHELTLWQPMQELKDDRDLLEKIRAAQANTISKFLKTTEELKDQLAFHKEVINNLTRLLNSKA